MNSVRAFHSSRSVRGLLKKIPPILSADLLKVLRSAGHGDQISIVDCNFPAVRKTGSSFLINNTKMKCVNL
jgi:L-fucose mutarotase/ribose pyranase (RbsD/FucU family)